MSAYFVQTDLFCNQLLTRGLVMLQYNLLLCFLHSGLLLQ